MIIGASLILIGLYPTAKPSPLPLVVNVATTPVPVSRNLFGVFFEEINHAGDGGLYPELLRNRAFHVDASGNPTDWLAHQGVTWGVQKGRATAIFSPGGLLENPGYWGVSLKKGAKYKIWLEGEGLTTGDVSEAAEFKVSFFQGNNYKFTKKVTIPYSAGPRAARWGKGVLTFASPITLTGGRIVIRGAEKWPQQLAYASILPVGTYKKSGLRTDLASAVEAIKPAFVRFPGGCYVEGGNWLRDRFQWKNTVASNDARPGHFNQTWGYWSTDGLGFHEYLQWCEDMHSQPLFVFNCGMSHKERVPINELGSYLQDALDGIEYANGPVTSKWGALRAKRGHPKPFGLRYVEIGNENGLFGEFGGTRDQYTARYLPIYKAIKKKYPYIRAVADTRVAAPMDIVDDHYYNSPAWFWQNVGLYDKAPRNGPKVYVGEYAVTSDCGLGNLKAGLAEAAFMTGLERNGDVVEMASYAPLFVNQANRAWNPDAIVFNGDAWYGTPSYWVQKLFADNRIDKSVPISVPKVVVPPTPGGVGFGTWRTQAEYKDVEVTLANGQVMPAMPPVLKSGAWTVADGSLTQTGPEEHTVALESNAVLGSSLDYTLKLRARKISGDEGFLILVRAKDNHNFIWWNIGGWGDTAVGAEKEVSGGRAVITREKPFHVETDRWYDIRIEAHGADLSLFVDGKLLQTAKDAGLPRLAANAGFDSAARVLVVKVVNGDSEDRDLDLRIPGIGLAKSATVEVLSDKADHGSAEQLMEAENSFAEPNLIGLSKATVAVKDGRIQLHTKRGSISVVRIALR